MRKRSFVMLAAGLMGLCLAVPLILLFGTREGFEYQFIPGRTYTFDPETQKMIIKNLQTDPLSFDVVKDEIFEKLEKKSNRELYLLKASGDAVCSAPLFECFGVPGK